MLSQRIWLTRYLMVIGIVILHTPPYQSLTELDLSFFNFIKAFFSHAVFRTTVPMLTVISGYLLFRSRLIQQPLELISKKARVILLPLILWNIPVVLGVFFIQHYQLSTHIFSVQLSPFDSLNWLNALTGLLSSPANYPLNFLRDLFVLSLISPLLAVLLNRAPWLGAIIVALVFYFNLDGDIILRNTMLISFYIGGLAATQRWNLTKLDPYAIPLLIIFILICSAIVIFDIENRTPLRIIAPFMIWPSMSLLMKYKNGAFLERYVGSSFLTFLAHGPLLLVFWLLYQTFLPKVPYPLFWCAAPLIITIGCAWLHTKLKRYVPTLTSIALGGR